MTSIIRMLPFSGVLDESPPSYLLQVDEFTFLLDCGWDEHFNMDYIKEIKKYIPQIDAVLVSYPDMQHLGALPYLVGKCGMSCPVYATTPVYKMGQMFMYDLYQSRHNSEEFDIFTLDDVDAAFDKIQQVKYSQNVSMKGKGHGLVITPLPAGHMIGGTIWKIVKDGEEEIVYAVDYNHKKERHLNGCVLDSIVKPHLLITDAYNALYEQERRRKRDEQLLTHIVTSVRNDGNVLVCCDTAGRVLELVHLLEQLWAAAESGLLVYSLAFLTNVSYNVVQFAKSQVEWMADKIMAAFETTRTNPYHFRHVHMCHSLADVKRLPEPKVVLASVPDLECGFSRDLFVDWSQSAKNTVILTSRSAPGTLARQLIDNTDVLSVTLEVRKRVKLQGEELEQYLTNKRKKEEEEEAELKGAGGAASSSDSSDTESDVGGMGGGGDSDVEHCRRSGLVGNVFTPALHELVDATTDSHIYQVKLTDLLVSSLKLSNCQSVAGGGGGQAAAQVAWLDGLVNTRGHQLLDTHPLQQGQGGDDQHPQYNEDKDIVDSMPTVQPLPLTKVPRHPAVFLNELRLSDFKHVLLDAGMQAEFNKGLLICNDCVSIRKITGGKVVLEGAASVTYYKVRELLYQQYVII